MKNKMLLKDIVIPAGTVFACIDGSETKFCNGNYAHYFGLTKDTTGRIVYGFDEDDPNIKSWFKDVE